MINRLATPSKRLAIGDAYTFLMKELEKVDETILEPLTSTEWPRDMPVVTGGGFVESVASIDITYGSSGGAYGNIIGDEANDIPVIQADLSKSVAKVFNWAEYISISLLEKEKMMGIGRDPEVFLNKGIHLHFDKSVDRSVYKGVPSDGYYGSYSTGLCNNPVVTRLSSAIGAGGTTNWADKTADEILADINKVISTCWKENDCSIDGMPNHILVPVEQYGYLVQNKVDDVSGMSILTYLMKNNVATAQGVDLTIAPSKWCTRAGSGNTDRMVVYRNDINRICFNMTQPLRRMDTERANMRIKIPYVGQFSEVRFLYPSTVRYMDGI